jgi:hypothetical protein
MNLAEINQQIDLNGKERDKILSLLEEIRNRFKASILDYASTWTKDTLEYHLIKENPEKAKQMGKSGLAAVKAEYKALIERFPKMVDDIVNDNKKWPHKAEYGLIFKENESSSVDTSAILTRMIRPVVSQLGPILKKYGLIQFKQYGGWEARGEELQYVHGFNLSPRLQQLLDDYKGRFDSYEKKMRDLTSLNNNKGQEEARILWEEP